MLCDDAIRPDVTRNNTVTYAWREGTVFSKNVLLSYKYSDLPRFQMCYLQDQSSGCRSSTCSPTCSLNQTPEEFTTVWKFFFLSYSAIYVVFFVIFVFIRASLRTIVGPGELLFPTVRLAVTGRSLPLRFGTCKTEQLEPNQKIFKKKIGNLFTNVVNKLIQCSYIHFYFQPQRVVTVSVFFF